MASLNYNSCHFCGRICNTLEKRITQNGHSVCSFSLAVNRKSKNPQTGDYDVDFLNFVVFGKTADFICTYFDKGSSVFLDCHAIQKIYENSEGKKVYSTEFVVDCVYFVDSKKLSSDDSNFSIDDDSIPF